MASHAEKHATIASEQIQKPVQRKKNDPFWAGGAAACMAACFTHPLDQTKYRMQVTSSRVNLLVAVRNSAVRDGIFSLWAGLSASLLRQAVYSTARFALYENFSKKISSAAPQLSLLSQNMLCAGVAGGLAGMIGNPTEIMLVRMSADGAKPVAERYGYRNPFVGLAQMAKQDGLSSYLRGLGPNLVRSVLMNISQIATYAEVKRRLLATKSFGLKDNTVTHTLASFIAGTVATTVCAPADVLKSRFQSASAADGKVSVAQYISDTAKKEGPLFLMKGWLPAWLRVMPHTVLTFVFMEKIKALVV